MVSRAGDRFSPADTGLFVSQVRSQSGASISSIVKSQVVSGGPALRAGLEKEDRVVRINNKTPRSIQDAIEILRKSKVNIANHSISPLHH